MTRPLSLQRPTRAPARPCPAPPLGPSPIARLLALAHAIERATEEGVATRAQIARALGFSRARLTQIANLAFLAPDLQAALIEARAPVPERALRQLASRLDWDEQRELGRRELAARSADC